MAPRFRASPLSRFSRPLERIGGSWQDSWPQNPHNRPSYVVGNSSPLFLDVLTGILCPSRLLVEELQAANCIRSVRFAFPLACEVPQMATTKTKKKSEAERRLAGRRAVSQRRSETKKQEDHDVENREDARRKGERRRQIDPTTCERDYSGLEVEFMRAMDEYKRRSGRQFPTWSEVLEVMHCLGYRKVAEPVDVMTHAQMRTV